MFSVCYKLFTEVQYTEKCTNLWSLLKLFRVNTLDNQYAKSRPCKSPTSQRPLGTLALPLQSHLCDCFTIDSVLKFHRTILKYIWSIFISTVVAQYYVCESKPYRVAGHLHFLPYSIFGMNTLKLICTFCYVLQISVYRFMVYRFLLMNVCIQLWEFTAEIPKPQSTDMLALVDPGE